MTVALVCFAIAGIRVLLRQAYSDKLEMVHGPGSRAAREPPAAHAQGPCGSGIARSISAPGRMATFFAKCPSFAWRADGSASTQKLCIVTLTGGRKSATRATPHRGRRPNRMLAPARTATSLEASTATVGRGTPLAAT